MPQSDTYKFVNEINYLADVVGADHARNALRMYLVQQESPLDVSAETVPTDPGGRDYKSDDTNLLSDAESTAKIIAEGSPTLNGWVFRKAKVDIVVDWEDGKGNVLKTETIESGVKDGTTFSTRMESPYATVKIKDTSSTEAKLKYMLHTVTTNPTGATESTLSSIDTKVATESTLSSIDTKVATESTLASIDGAVATEASLTNTLSREIATWSAGTLTTDPSSNVSAESFDNGAALASGGTLTRTLSASSAKALTGRVVRASTSYTVEVDWKDDAGNVLFTDSVASGVTAGTETDINIDPAPSPYCDVRIVDAGSASGAVTSSLHLR